MERTEIGKFLYQERKKRHLTQKKFLGGNSFRFPVFTRRKWRAGFKDE